VKKFQEIFIRLFADKQENGTISFKSLYLLIFWPVFGIAFQFLEKLYTPEKYYIVHCRLDDIIPFNEIFVIPYFFWFAFMVGMHFYSFFVDRNVYRQYVKFIIYTYTFTLVMYILFPTCQNLRPLSFERDNILTKIMAQMYEFDTNTNVCPSMHVIGSVAVMHAAHKIERLKKLKWRLFFDITTVLICLSTVFLKQHSAIDILAAVPVCIGGYMLAFKNKVLIKKTRKAGIIMEEKLAIVSIIIEKKDSIMDVNKILNEFGDSIIGRMGLPRRKNGVNLISVAVESSADTINALSGKLGRLDGITTKTIISNV